MGLPVIINNTSLMKHRRIHYISKYVLDYARDSWSGSACFPIPFALEYQQTLSYKRRADGRMERQFRHFTAAVDITDLFNSRYQEVIGGDMPGRWFGVSLRTR